MPYFVILPAYIVLLAALVGASVVVRFHSRFRPASAYLLGGAVGTLIGFVVLNSVVLLVGIAPVWLEKQFTFPDWLKQTSRFFVAASLLIGPFFGSAAGVFIGFTVGVYSVFRRRNRAA